MIANIQHDGLTQSLERVDGTTAMWDIFSRFLSPDEIRAFTYHNFPALGASDYQNPYIYHQSLIDKQDSIIDINSIFERTLREQARGLSKPVLWDNWKELEITKGGVLLETPFGLSIPVHGPLGRTGCFSFEFMKSTKDAQGFETEFLHWICQRSHETMCRLLTQNNQSLPKLTPREKDILTWMALGKSNAEIALTLDISFHTVGTYTRRIFVKTNTSNRTSAALFGISNGLINV